MFSNKNINKFKKQKGGENPVLQNPDMNLVQNPIENPLQNPLQNPIQNPLQNPLQNPIVQNPIENPIVQNPVVGASSYPNADYLYDKITSFKSTESNIKTYICAFTINTDLDTHFVKYIVQRKESSITFPVFNFNLEQGSQQQPMQQPMVQQPIQEQPMQEPMVQQPIQEQPMQQPMQEPMQEPMVQQPIQQPMQQPMQEPMVQQPMQEPMQQPMQEPMVQQPMQEPMVQQPMQEPLVQQPIQQPMQEPLQQQPMQQPMVQQPMQEQPLQQQPMQQQPMQQQPMQEQPLQQQQMQQQPMVAQNNGIIVGGFVDNDKNEESLDTMFKTQVVEFVKNMFEGQQEPSFIGYIPHISESNAVFVFVKIEALPPTNFIPCIPNELVFLNKVFNLDTDNIIKDLFANNTWLYVNENVSSPYSGYLCKKNENNQIVNVTKEELNSKNVADFLIDIDEIGTYFYFSFLPLDTQNAESLERFALLPMEYECILDAEKLNYYKQNIISFENTNSFYVNGELFSQRQPFFIIKNTSQFTKI